MVQMRQFNLERRKVIKKGYLVKRGHIRKNWKRRSFELTSDALSYYESETSEKPKGVNLNELYL